MNISDVSMSKCTCSSPIQQTEEDAFWSFKHGNMDKIISKTFCLDCLLHTVPSNRHLIKLCPKGAQNCVRLFCRRDLDINPMTLKLDGDLDILKMYLHTENEVARF